MSDKHKVFDKEIIKDFAEDVNNDMVRRAYYYVNESIDQAIQKISLNNIYIKEQNIELIPVGDLMTNTFTNVSEIDLLLTIRSAQLELNSIKKFDNKFLSYINKFKRAWKINKNNKKKNKLKNKLFNFKKNKNIITKQTLYQKKKKLYNIFDIKNNLFEEMTNYFTNLTILYNEDNKISILSKDEIGYKVNIYPVFKHENYLRIFNKNDYKYKEIKIKEALQNIKNKANEIYNINKLIIDDEFIFNKIIKIFKNLYFNIKHENNFIFVESLIYSCPTSLFKIEKNDENNYIYNIFIKVLNYINSINLSKIKSIYNDEKTIYQQDEISLYNINSFIKLLSEMIL